ncbi:MAG: threonine synthase [Pseudomonadota bacterium]
MQYSSTRDAHHTVSFEKAFLSGLAPDGGLYLPHSWPQVPLDIWQSWRNAPYETLAFNILQPFVAGSLNTQELRDILRRAYKSSFHHAAHAPLRQLHHNMWLLELFHGPTLAFKDFGLQFLGQCFAHFLDRAKKKINIIGATSGDTGSAAIAGCRGIDAINIFILHPHERISPIQRRQMTCVDDANVFNLAIQGNFDDCQAHVKAMFGDAKFRETHALSAVNSINWGRIAEQIVYYAYAALRLGAPDHAVDFVVPSGNFGNVFACYCLKCMGLPIGKMVLATNQNNILHRFVTENSMQSKPVIPSIAPSMDIQTSSNFERLFACYADHDDRIIRQAYAELEGSGNLPVAPDIWQNICQDFRSGCVDDDGMLNEIGRIHKECDMIIDPHTAIGTQVARHYSSGDNPCVVLATAHAAKFPDAIARALNITPELPSHQHDLLTREEHFDILPNDLAAIQSYIAARALKV